MEIKKLNWWSTRAPSCEIRVDDKTSTIDYFKNLGCTISWDCRDDKEVPIRSAQAKAAFHQLRGILCNKKLSFECRYPVLKCFMCTRFIYIAPRLGPYRSISRIRSLALKCGACAKCKECQGRPRRSNVDVRKLTCGQASLLKNIKERQLRFVSVGVLRKQQLEDLALTGKIEGKKQEESRGLSSYNSNSFREVPAP